MKIKKYVFRSTVAATAFLFSLGGYAVWRYVQSPFLKTQTALPNAREISSPVRAERIRIAVEPYLPKKDIAAPKSDAAFDPEGYYSIADETPKGFEDFDSFNIVNKNYENEDEYGELIAPDGAVQTTREYKFARINIGGGQIQFETARVKGISYSFSGRFTETRNFVELESEAVERVLEGRLEKKRNGKTVVARDVKFGWSMGGASCGC